MVLYVKITSCEVTSKFHLDEKSLKPETESNLE